MYVMLLLNAVMVIRASRAPKASAASLVLYPLRYLFCLKCSKVGFLEVGASARSWPELQRDGLGYWLFSTTTTISRYCVLDTT